MNTPIALDARGVAAAVALSLLGIPPAFAQGTSSTANADQDSSAPLQEVVVSARHREESLQQTPIAITTITADDIQQRGFTVASEIICLHHDDTHPHKLWRIARTTALDILP
jgi:outer membrane receptor for ferrienterochelin and colicin